MTHLFQLSQHHASEPLPLRYRMGLVLGGGGCRLVLQPPRNRATPLPDRLSTIDNYTAIGRRSDKHVSIGR